MTRIGRVAAVLLTASCAVMARAAEPEHPGGVQIGKGIVCDTEQQAQRFAALLADRGGAGAALDTVNKEANNPLACGMAMIAFKPGRHVGDVHNDKGTYKIMEIQIFAAATPQGWRTVNGATQFAAMPVEGIEI
jgi:hypothetical protein